MVRRAVVMGVGIVSCLGNNLREVFDSLYHGRSGVSCQEEYRRLGLRSQIAGSVRIQHAEYIDRKSLRFMRDAAAYACIAMQQAVEDAGLRLDQFQMIGSGLLRVQAGRKNLCGVGGLRRKFGWF